MATAEPSPPVTPKRILVVGDQLVVALSMRTILVTDQHLVEISENAENALARFKASPHDLVITDFQLDKMNGLELAAAVKHRSPTTPVFLVTAYGEQFNGNVPNIDLVLGKPFSVPQLQAAVRKALSPF
jgi:CheY-like chemotaxis protein